MRCILIQFLLILGTVGHVAGATPADKTASATFDEDAPYFREVFQAEVAENNFAALTQTPGIEPQLLEVYDGFTRLLVDLVKHQHMLYRLTLEQASLVQLIRGGVPRENVINARVRNALVTDASITASELERTYMMLEHVLEDHSSLELRAYVERVMMPRLNEGSMLESLLRAGWRPRLAPMTLMLTTSLFQDLAHAKTVSVQEARQNLCDQVLLGLQPNLAYELLAPRLQQNEMASLQWIFQIGKYEPLFRFLSGEYAPFLPDDVAASQEKLATTPIIATASNPRPLTPPHLPSRPNFVHELEDLTSLQEPLDSKFFAFFRAEPEIYAAAQSAFARNSSAASRFALASATPIHMDFPKILPRLPKGYDEIEGIMISTHQSDLARAGVVDGKWYILLNPSLIPHEKNSAEWIALVGHELAHLILDHGDIRGAILLIFAELRNSANHLPRETTLSNAQLLYTAATFAQIVLSELPRSGGLLLLREKIQDLRAQHILQDPEAVAQWSKKDPITARHFQSLLLLFEGAVTSAYIRSGEISADRLGAALQGSALPMIMTHLHRLNEERVARALAPLDLSGALEMAGKTLSKIDRRPDGNPYLASAITLDPLARRIQHHPPLEVRILALFGWLERIANLPHSP